MIRRDGVRIELVAGNAQQSCRFCRRPRSSHLQRADPSRLRYHEASNPGSYIGRVARTSASRRVLSDSSEAHGQTEIRPPRVEAIPPRPEDIPPKMRRYGVGTISLSLATANCTRTAGVSVRPPYSTSTYNVLPTLINEAMPTRPRLAAFRPRPRHSPFSQAPL